jgi:uracil-DNA glycosylase family 4
MELHPLILEIQQGCRDCPWQGRKSRTVGPEGPTDSPLMVVGRNPGYKEDQSGRPFIGPAGQHLDRFLRDIGISRQKIYITNTAKCYGGAGDPNPTDDVFNCCESFLNREIALLKPRLIVPFGFDAYRRLTSDVSPISVIQGRIQKFRHQPDRFYFPMTHPSMWARTRGYYDTIILNKVVPAFRQVLDEMGILQQLT